MNFKEQYKSTFSEIHASEKMKQKLLSEAKDMKGNTIKMTKGKKKITALLIAAALAATSAVVVNAGALNEAVENVKLFINGEEVSASDYITEDGLKVTTEDGDEFVFYNIDLPEGVENAKFEMYLDEIDEDTHSSSVVITDDVNLDAEDMDELLNQLRERNGESEEVTLVEDTLNAAAE